jgi:hypothetical protein
MKILIAILCVLILSCSKVKEVQYTNQPSIERDDFTPSVGFNLFKRKITPELKKASEDAARLNRGKKPRNDTTITPPPEPYSGDYVIYYDFDGGYLPGNTIWSYEPVILEPSGMTPEAIAQAMAAYINAYAPYHILVTADSTEYFKRPIGKRQRIYVTQTYEWWGNSGGVAVIGSFFTGNDTPAFVFSSLLSYSGKWVGDVGVHEAGHTIGLRHQGDWKNGVMTSSYSYGFTPNRSPHMGVSYYDSDGGEFLKETWVLDTWYIRPSNFIDQIDHDIILTKVGAKI